MIVIDSSYALSLVMPDETRPASAGVVLQELLCAPMIWPVEIANGMRTGVRRHRMTREEAVALCADLNDWEVKIVAPLHDDASRHLDFALQHDLTPHDALYLALALQKRCAIATHDEALAKAASRTGLSGQ